MIPLTPTFGIAAAVADIQNVLFWLTNVVDLIANIGSSPAVFDRGTSTATVESWDSVTVLKLITTGADGIASRSLRYDAGVWYNDDDLGNKLHPTKTVEGADVFLLYDYWTAKAYPSGDNVYVVGSDGWNYALTSQGGTSATIPSVAKTDIGSTVSDGVVTWDVDSYYSGLASATANYLPGILHEPVAVNIALQSQDFDNATWAKGGTTSVTANSTSAPDGNTTADTLGDDASTGTGNAVILDTLTTATSTEYYFSVYAKKKQLDWLFLDIAGMTAQSLGAYYDLGNGVVGTVEPSVTSSGIEFAGNDWYRCWFAFTSDGTDTEASYRVYAATGDGNIVVDLDGTSDVYIWQADLVAESAVSSPIATTTGSVQRNASTETSPQVFSAQFIRCRATGNLLPSEVLYSDGTNILNWDGSDVTFTDGSATLTATFALAQNDDIVVDTTDGKLYINGSLKDTDGTIAVTWGALTDIGNVSDLAESPSFDPTDQDWKTP